MGSYEIGGCAESHAPLPRKVVVKYSGGAIFDVVREHSKFEALWAELFKEKERALLRKKLESGDVLFSMGEHTFEVMVRLLRIPPPEFGATEYMREPVAVLLHDTIDPLTNSWCWSKFMFPLYQAGFSVVAIDFPGFGRSSCSGSVNVSPSTWLDNDWKVVQKVLDRLKITKAHFVATGETCNTVMKVMNICRNRFESTAIFYNPVLHLNSIISFDVYPGTSPERLQVLRKEQLKRFDTFLHSIEVKIWCTFDDAKLSRCLNTLELLTKTQARIAPFSYFPITQISAQHIHTATVGSAVGFSILFPCKWLKVSWIRFLKGDATLQLPAAPSELPTPSGSTNQPSSLLSPSDSCSESLREWAVSDPLSAAMLGSGQRRRPMSRSRQRDVCHIQSSSTAAAQRMRLDPVPERQRVLANARQVTKLQNWAEMREPTRAEADIHPEESQWLDDALDASMETLDEDEQRRIALRGGRSKYDRTVVREEQMFYDTLKFNRTNIDYTWGAR